MFLFCLCLNMFLCFCRLIGFMKYGITGFGTMVVITKRIFVHDVKVLPHLINHCYRMYTD
jgi:hypothetical protein